MEYTTAYGDGRTATIAGTKLARRVKELTEVGWRPQGGVSLVVDEGLGSAADDAQGFAFFRCAQAMVKDGSSFLHVD